MEPSKRDVIAQARKAAERRALARELVRRMIATPAQPEFVGPSADQLAALRRSIERTEPGRANRDVWDRRVSNKVAAEMRKRGWLKPENEGYAPGSWAAP